jgi:hypothetical protein
MLMLLLIMSVIMFLGVPFFVGGILYGMGHIGLSIITMTFGVVLHTIISILSRE